MRTGVIFSLSETVPDTVSPVSRALKKGQGRE